MLRERDRLVAEKGGLTIQDRADLAASFQAAVADVLSEKTRRGIDEYLSLDPSDPVVAVAGGVAANQILRARLNSVADDTGARFVAPPLALCTDIAAMIAWAGIELLHAGYAADTPIVARPRWPLDQSQAPMLGSGKKGAKA